MRLKHQWLFVGLIMLSVSVFAQDIKTVRKLYDKKEWQKGKDAVDQLLANPAEQNNWEAWYYKGLIYGQIAKMPELKASVQDIWMVSFDAYKKAMELDEKQSANYMTLRGYPIFDNYLEMQKEGNDLFNGQSYKEALAKYKQADQVGRLIYKNGWALTEVDTVLYYFAGAAALQANMNDDAITYFKKIADASISGDGYDICYRFLTYQYDKKGNAELSAKYASLGRKLYPNDTYYDKLDLERERNSKGLSPDLFSKYELVIGKEPDNYEIRYSYAAELFNWLYTEQKADQKAGLFDKIIIQVNKCIAIDPKNTDAYVLAGKTYYNEAAMIQESGKGLKATIPEEKKKKDELKVQMDKRMNEALSPLEKALEIFEKMTPEDFKAERRLKNEFKSTLYLLTEAHKFLGNTDKEKLYNRKYEALNQ